MWFTSVGSWFSFLVQCICLTVLHDLQLPRRLEIILWLRTGPTGRFSYLRLERPRYLSTDQPHTQSRSLLSRSRVNRAVEAARRVGGGLIVAALNVPFHR